MAKVAKSEGPRLERVRASRQFVDGVVRNPSGLGPELKGSSPPPIGE